MSIQYVLKKENNKIWKFSLSSYNKSNTTAYYYCSDTNCTGRGLIKYILDGNTEYEKKINGKEELINTKNHSIDYEDHSYQKYKQVILDLEQINKKDLIL